MTRILAYCEGCKHALYESDISANGSYLAVDDGTVLTCPNCDRVNEVYSHTVAKDRHSFAARSDKTKHY